MIDFRYHLVSLAAVLIALSIGIVLGAGPLNDNIGSTLSGEVTKLRQEKEALRAESNEQQRQIEGRDAYDEQTLPAVVRGRLTDHHVAVVALPEAPDDDVKAVTKTLQTSGASVGDVIEVNPDWAVEGDQATSRRTSSGESALKTLGVTPAIPSGAQGIDQALAVILTGTEDSKDGGTVPTKDRAAAWKQLRDDGLVDGPEDLPATADLVVVLGGPVTAKSPEPSRDAATVDRTAERTAAVWLGLTHLLQTHADGTVLAAAEAQPGTADASPLTMARLQGSLADGTSTVDVPEIPMGRAAIVLALVQQLDGASGDYGLGQSADGPIPALQ